MQSALASYDNIETNKSVAALWFQQLRNEICSAFEAIEREQGSSAVFARKKWDRAGGGGGEISIMHGEVFEKVGVNISTVFGILDPQFAIEVPGATEIGEFWASGISLVAHMNSPFIPAIHMNTRLIVTSKAWFGGGIDLTPTFPDDAETTFFHQQLQQACDRHSLQYYKKFKEACDQYFFLKHRAEPRGVGGIFYDGLNSGIWEKDFAFTQSVGRALCQAFIPIIQRKRYKPWSASHKDQQLLKRGRYVEFNLLYDKGTRFGLMTSGNIEAIFMSLPPNVKWA